MHSRLCFAILALAVPTPGLRAQDGRADLRYRAPLPDSVTYVTVDSMWSTIGGTPMGDIATTMVLHTTAVLRLDPAGDSILVRAALKEMQGTVSSPMGEMPLRVTDLPPQEARIDARGLQAKALLGSVASPPLGAGADMARTLGSTKAMTTLLMLPGRTLALGESWTDTAKVPVDMEGMTGDVVLITHGTYAADTVVAGKTLNVLRIATETTSTMAGAAQGRSMSHATTVTGTERVLWDSERHYAVHRDSHGEMRSTMSMPAQGMNMTVTGRTRSIVTAQAND